MKTDHYIQNRAMQPKREIAEYVRSNGILVPKIFDSLEEAKKSGLYVIFRSEHPQDYDGASDLFPTITLDKDHPDPTFPNPAENERVRRFCHFHGLDLEEFASQVSYTPWKYITGHMRMVIADSAIKDRYHVGTMLMGGVQAYNLVEGGKIKTLGGELSQDWENNVLESVEIYEKVRNLERFNPDHCPLMEFQAGDDGNIYFLQYHKTRDFEESGWTLDREPEENEVPMEFVRGATKKEGMELEIMVASPSMISHIHFPYDREIKGSAGLYYLDGIFGELTARDRELQLTPFVKSLEGFMIDVGCGHKSRTLMYKPRVSCAYNPSINNPLFSFPELKKAAMDSMRDKRDITATVKVFSDGRKAYVRRMK